MNEIWWCWRCDWRFDPILPATHVWCPKGHRCKKATTEKQLIQQKIQEGVL